MVHIRLSIIYNLKMTDRTSRLQQWLENIWYNNGKGRYLLLLLTPLYCAINYFQRWNQTRNLIKLPCPVIIVGNIMVGGTGKTPLTIYLVKLLQEAGYKPAIITRGYGSEATAWSQSAGADTDPKLTGDEAVLMATRTDVPVYAGADRLKSIKQLLEMHDCDVIVSDDGLQHYKLPRDIEIAVIDATRMLGNGSCLPAGPLRVNIRNLDSCDLVVLNGEPSAKNKHEVKKNWLKMKLEGDLLINLKTGEEKTLTSFSDSRVTAVTGIGNPQRFFDTLEQGGLDLQTYSFPDHHNFKQSDLVFNNDLAVVMTEKDAVKCKNFASENYWYLPVTAKIDEQFDSTVLQLLKSITDLKGEKIVTDKTTNK